MADQRDRVSEVYAEALTRPEFERAAFLRRACGADEALRVEVESLLAHSSDPPSILEAPLGSLAAAALADSRASLIGRAVGGYHILATLGAGGMGEVYRAADSKLGRDVAIKILPRAFASDQDRLARFEREARVLASLNHPHIGAIYGLEDVDGTLALVLELVEGETLAERLARGSGPRASSEKPDPTQKSGGALPIKEALSIGRQITEALEAAHEKGIVHRDLKPANIKITPDSLVKVLDFGLAKAAASDRTARDLSQSLTVTPGDTCDGVILGTAAYMSPEQARGLTVDKRTDIWAFGCVLYEMLTGQPVFFGETVSDTIAASLEREPDWHALPSTTPAPIRRLLRRCLEKDRKRRLDSAAGARLEIDDALASPGAETVTVGAAPSWRVAPVAITALAAGAVMALVAWGLTRPRAPLPPSRFAIVLPPSETLNIFGAGRGIALSPDGRHLVYRAGGTQTGGSPLMVRAIDQLDARPVVGIDNAVGPFFSPDSQWIGFVTLGGNNTELKKVSITGGPAITLCRIHGVPYGASWGDDNAIVFAASDPGTGTGLWQVSAGGGAPTVLTKPDTRQGENSHVFPSVLPGSRRVLFTIMTAGPDKSQVAILDRKTGQRKTLVRGGSDAEYVESGHLIYAAAGTLRVARFNLARLEVLSEAVPVVEPVRMTTAGAANYDVSRSGTLIYVPGGTGPQRSLVWVDRKGREEPLKAPARNYGVARLSPDGSRVVVEITDQDADLWIWDLVREGLTRLTVDPANDVMPVWTPDGRRVIFASQRARTSAFNPYNLYWVAVDGTGTVERLTTSASTHMATSITPDGTRIVGFEPPRAPGTGFDIVQIPLASPSKPEPFVHTSPFNESFPEVSPDGHYLAYQSDEAGHSEVYVRPFPQGDRGRWQVSREGGTNPAWARNGRELFYLDGSKTLTAVPVQMSESTFSAGTQAKVFDAKYSSAFPARHYDVSPDGQRFLMIKDVAVGDQNATPASLIVVEHWLEEIKVRVPPN